ncbi:hypothetical protein [Flavobacterium sp. 11]|uniref:hypothetical protein n=1 Tax=Flavobacterium sp. 11 TaxID=357523 RepID=UPI00117AD67A|nr:hypothetical protein [Flavobacterium sp. 11]
MAYIITTLPDEQAYRQLFLNTYCNIASPVFTNDGLRVSFSPNNFNHSFFESSNRRNPTKDVFSIVRAERILWIKETLEDPTSDLRIGWDNKTKSYDNSRRVAIVKNDYVVIISIINPTKAIFISAYVADNSIGKILMSPVWTGI